MQSKVEAQGGQTPVVSYKQMTAKGKKNPPKLSNIICIQMIGVPGNVQQDMEF